MRLEVTSLLQRGAFRGESSLKTYVWRITGHTCLDAIRAQTRASARDAGTVDDLELASPGSPLDQYLQKETAGLLLRVLDTMPAECRALWGMILAGRSYQDMSEALEIAEGTLRVRVLRCRRKAVEARDRLLAAAPGDAAVVTPDARRRL